MAVLGVAEVVDMLDELVSLFLMLFYGMFLSHSLDENLAKFSAHPYIMEPHIRL